MDVPKLGPKAYEQCAGFLRINDGTEPLDATGVHPESYAATETLLEKLGVDKELLNRGGVADIEDIIREKYPVEKKRSGNDYKKKERKLSDSGLAALAVLLEDENFNPALKKKKAKKPDKGSLKRSIGLMAEDIGIGAMTLSDIVEEIKKPGRDPREAMPEVIFRQDVLSFEDLKPGMELQGTVRNVVDFGAFVDIGVKQDGLVHVSQLSDSYIKDPMSAVSVGDTVKVRILEVDRDKQKIALTMKTK